MAPVESDAIAINPSQRCRSFSTTRMSSSVFARCSILTLLGFVLTACVGYAQLQSVAAPGYEPVTSLPPQPPTLAADILAHAEAEKRAARTAGRHKNELAKFYGERANEIFSSIRDSAFYFGGLVQPFYARVFGRMVESVGQPLGPNVRLLLSRDPNANAYCVGNGVHVYNLALTRVFNTEDQVAFVLGHELGHYLLGHVDSSFIEGLARAADPAFKQRLAEARRRRYGATTAVSSLLTEAAYESRRHSRAHEYAADSVAVALLARAGYDARQAVPALLQLDSSDYEQATGSIDLPAVFGSAAFPFRAEWTESHTNPFFGAGESDEAEAHADSLKTHPDCTARAAAAERMLASRTASTKAATPLEAAQRRAADFELVENLYHSRDFSRCVYHTLLLLRAEPNNAYLVSRLGGALNGCRAALAAHRLHEAVRPPTPFDRGDYKTLSAFLNNLRLSEMSAVNFHFLDRHYATMHTAEPFLHQYIIAAHAAGEAMRRDAAVQTFNSLFPESPRRAAFSALR